MTDHDPPLELPLPCVLDDDDVDRLLERLRAVHGEPRRDITAKAAPARPPRLSAAQNLRPRRMTANFAKLPELLRRKADSS